jgi:hypothetical protein
MAASTEMNGDGLAANRIRWNRERMLLFPCLAMIIAYAGIVGISVALSFPDLIDFLGRPIGNDFISFWSAARLAIDGHPEAAYSWRAISLMHQLALPALKNVAAVWHHPPTFLLVVYPLGFLPYLPALCVFLTATVALWAALIRRMFSDPRAWLVAAAFPVGLLNFHDGQDGFLTAGLAGFAMLALDRRPVLAGILIGLLAIKPHLAVLFPVALLAERRWQSFAAAATTALIFTSLSVAAFGWVTIEAFYYDLRTIRSLLDSHMLSWNLVPSVYISALSIGASGQIAAALQVVMVFAASGCTWFVWRSRTAPREAKMATLAAAPLLVSPFIFAYDLTWAGLAIAWLAKLGMRRGFVAGEGMLLLALGIGAGASPFIYNHWGMQVGWVPPFVLTVLGALNAFRSARPGAETAGSR